MSALNNKSKKKTSQAVNTNQSNAWFSSENKPQQQSKQSKNAVNKQNVAKAKFREAQLEHLQAAKKHIQDYESSSEEEELECDALLESVFKGYAGDRQQLQKTQEFLEHVFQSGAATCLICIATVKRSDYVSVISSNHSHLFSNSALFSALDVLVVRLNSIPLSDLVVR